MPIYTNPTRPHDADVIKIFQERDPEYARLEAAAALVRLFTGEDLRVETTWFDYGQGWQWTTLIHHKKSDTQLQALYASQQAAICRGNFNTFMSAVAELIRSAGGERR